MKQTIGVTVLALGLVATGAFLSTFISNPLASNQLSSALPSGQAPVLVNANGAQISVVPSIGADGRPVPVVINVGAAAPLADASMQPQATPVAYRPMVQSAAYEPAPRPRRAISSSETGTRSWQKKPSLSEAAPRLEQGSVRLRWQEGRRDWSDFWRRGRPDLRHEDPEKRRPVVTMRVSRIVGFTRGRQVRPLTFDVRYWIHPTDLEYLVLDLVPSFPSTPLFAWPHQSSVPGV